MASTGITWFAMRGTCNRASARTYVVYIFFFFLCMNIFVYFIGGFAVVLVYLAWREHAIANARDAKFLAGLAVCTGLGGVASAWL